MSKAKLRVIFITPGGRTSRGGMGSMADYLIQACQSLFPEVEIRVLDSYGHGRSWVMPLCFLRTFFSLGLACIVRKPHLVHLNLAAYGSTARKLLLMHLAHLFRVPTLLHIHASEFIPFCESLSPRMRRVLIASLARAGRIVVIGEYWRRYFVETLGLSPDKVVVVYNAVPIAPEVPARPAGSGCRILALGLLGPRKGTGDLLEALATPEMRSLSWTAVIAGNGAVEQSRERAKALGLSERVEFPGWVGKPQVRELLKAADVFVLPSHNEGLPVAILEAMGAGLPVVTTPVGAITELVATEQTGLIVPPGKPAELAAALARLVASPELRRTFGDAGRKRVESQFQITQMATRFVTLYRELASNASSSGEPMMNSMPR